MVVHGNLSSLKRGCRFLKHTQSQRAGVLDFQGAGTWLVSSSSKYLNRIEEVGCPIHIRAATRVPGIRDRKGLNFAVTMARFMRPIFTRATIFWGDVSISVHSGRFTTLESTDPPLKNTTLNLSSLPQTIPDRALKNISQMQISHARTRMIGLSFQLDKRFFSGESSDLDYTHEIDEINAKFAEAREEIDMALESKETVYFDEEAETAKAAVKVALDMFNALLAKLPDAERGAVQRSMGLKMEQLKAELEQLNEQT